MIDGSRNWCATCKHNYGDFCEFGEGGRVMKIEITYNSGEKFTAYLADESYENVIACLMDDVSVSALHSMDKAEEK